MKTTSPHSRGRALALAALSLGLISTSIGASYTVQLYSEVGSIGKYTFAPDANLAADLGTYAGVATSSQGLATTYWSFCLESSEHFQSGKTYNASSGGTTTSTNDPISVGTAYLYEQFVMGNLGGVLGYDAAGGTRMQKMIWHLEDENGAGFGQYDADLGNLLIDAGYADLTAMKANYSGTGVGVLVMTKGNDSLAGTARQDQLVYWGRPPTNNTPPPTNRVPDGGTTLLLFGLSLAGLGFAKRKQKA